MSKPKYDSLAITQESKPRKQKKISTQSTQKINLASPKKNF
jgi:hypothetical protein